LRHEIIIKEIKEKRWKKSKPKSEVIKTGLPILNTGVSDFSRTNRVQVGFEI
jgi:hypothetical protein